MQKWNIHCAIRRGAAVVPYKPRSTILVSPHQYLHTTSPRAQEDSTDSVAKEPSQPQPPPTRAQRLQQATSSIEDLYHHSSARDRFAHEPAVLGPRSMGVPLSRDTIEGRREARSSNDNKGAGRTSADGEVMQRAVDARNFGASRDGAQGPQLLRKVGSGSQGRDANQLAVHARSLAASLNTSKPPYNLIKKRKKFAMRQHSERDGEGLGQTQPVHWERHIQLDPSAPVGETLVRDVHTDKENRSIPTAYQDGSARSTRAPRAEIAGHARQTQQLEKLASFPSRGRSNRSRASPNSNSGDSERRRPKPGGRRDNRGNAREGPKKARSQETWSEEEQQYLKRRGEREMQQQVPYELPKVRKKMFIGMGPAFASDERGMSETLREHLLLARKYVNHDFIQWGSKEQKADVMALVEKLKAAGRGRISNNEDVNSAEKTSSPASVGGGQQIVLLMQKLLAGEYAKFKRSRETDVLGQVERHVQRNDSFSPLDESSLLDKVKSILPARAAKVERRTEGK